VVIAGRAVSHWIEHQTGWTIKKFVAYRTHYRTVQILAEHHTLTAAGPLPDDLRNVLAKLSAPGSAH